MKTIITISLAFFIAVNIFAQTDKKYQSYLAHISAANSSLRLNEKKEAKRWLENAPEQYRGWEWNYLKNRIDGSIAKFELKDDSPTKISYSHDGKFVTFVDTKGIIHIFNSQTLNEVKQISGHLNSIYSVKFYPDDTKLISCSRDTTIRIWDFNSSEEIAIIKTEGRGLADVDISPDGKNLIYCSWYMKENGVNGFINLYDLETKEKIWTTDYNAHPLVVVSFSPDGNRFAIGSWEENVSVWSLDNLNSPTILDFDDVKEYSAVDDIAFSPDGKFIASASKNTIPRVWETETGKLIHELKGHQKPVISIAYSKDGEHIYTSGNDATIIVWDSFSGKKLTKVFGHEDTVSSISVSPDGKYFVTSSADKTVRLWNAEYDLEFSDPKGRHKDIMYAFDLSDDGKILATGGPDSTLSIWNAQTGELITNYSAMDAILNAAVLSPDNKYVAVCNWGKDVNVFNTETGTLFRKLTGMSYGSGKLAYSKNGKFVAAISAKKELFIWNVANGKLLAQLPLESRPFALNFSNDSKLLATGEANGKIILWSTESFSKVIEIEAHSGQPNEIVFSKDDKYLYSGGEDKIAKMWEAKSGKLIKEFKGHTQRVYTLDVALDGKRLATGSSDLTARLWDIETGESTIILSDFTNPLYQVRFYPDGKRLIANSMGVEIVLYKTE
jgi:WD40 repeat protein